MGIVGSVKNGMRKIFGSRNDRVVKGYRKRVEHINAKEGEIRKLSDGELKDIAKDLAKRIKAEGKSADSMYEAFAIMRESLDRNVGIRNIFNPLHSEGFDAGRLSGAAREVYEKVLKDIEGTEPEEVKGQDEAAPAWLVVDIPVVLYEAVRELYPESRPPFRCRPFDVQLIGGMVLSEGTVAEMKTGEGKTIVAPLACFMAVTEGLKCHVVTVNDYLVQRDRDWVFPAFYKLGVTVGAIHPHHQQDEEDKREAYRCNITYGTNSEFGFDYLRDNMKLSKREQMQDRRDFCIVDEVDSILIDEARTPLIISGPAHDDAPQYAKANNVAEKLAVLQAEANRETAAKLKGNENYASEAARRWKQPTGTIEKAIAKFNDLGPQFLEEKEADYIGHTQYYVVKPEQKQAYMTPAGVAEAQKVIGSRFYVVGEDMAWDHLINNAIKAHAVYEKDKEYVVQNGEVIIVDEFTGRLMIGRQWSDGLHQAVESKESKHGVKIQEETQTLATITIQNFFKLYSRLAGMTGTAETEATEFHEIYKMDVVAIPTNKPVVRDDFNDLIFLTQAAKWNAIVDEIKEVSDQGRPVLVGTTSVEKSEMVSQLLTKRHNMEHSVLNAKQHEKEAHIVEGAGHQHEVGKKGKMAGNVTIATNMAGRGTDIKLTEEVRDAGGLHIVGTERHEARRIDNQLRGRAGRQGDPGSSRFFISMEDDLMKLFAGKATMRALSMLGMKDDDAIEHPWITKSVSRAQRKVEERNFQIRKSLLEYDEVMDHQRHSFYSTRQAVLEGKGIKALIFDYIAEAVEDACAKYIANDFVPTQVSEAVKAVLGVNIDPKRLDLDGVKEAKKLILSDAKAEVRQDIEINVGEYMSHDYEKEDWDLEGLSRWARNRFDVDMGVRKLREMEPEDVIGELTEAAHGMIDDKNLDVLEKFYEPLYGEGELANWVEHQFGIEFEAEELKPLRNELEANAQQRIAELIYQRAEELYQRREIEYPVEFVLDMAFGAAQEGGEAGAWAVEQLVVWANQRYEMGWTLDDLGRLETGEKIHGALVEAAREWNGSKVEAWVDGVVRQTKDAQKLSNQFEERWGKALDVEQLEEVTDEAEVVREYVNEEARGMLRLELTQLEQYVLLQILDQIWKDHLYAMDQLKDGIGLRGFAEKDPKIEYKAEGARMFQRMLQSIRDQVTDTIFKARLTADYEMRDRWANQQASHQVAEGSGVTAGMMTDEQRADLAAAQAAGGGEDEVQVVETIRKTGPDYGRNDRVVVKRRGTGEEQVVKFKKAEGMLGDGWEVVGLAEEA